MRMLAGRTIASPRVVPVLDARRVRMLALLLVFAAAAYFGRQPSWLIALAIWGVVAVLVLLQRPWIGIPCLLLGSALIWRSIGTGTGSSINVAMLGVAGLGALWLLRTVLEHDFRLRPSPANAPWIMISVIAGVSIIAGEAMWNPWVVTQANFLVVQVGQLSIYVLSALAFFIGANFVRTRIELERIAWLMVALGVLLALRLLPQLEETLTGVFTWVSPMGRVWVIAMALGLGLFYTKPPRWLRVTLGGLAIAITVIPILFIQDWASGWMPSLMVVGVILFMWLWIQHGKVVVPVVIGLVFVVAIVGIAVASATGIDRWSFDTRAMALSGLFGMMGDRWLFGLGLASYWHYWRGVYGVASYLDPTTGYQHYTFNPQVNMHNNYADIFGQMGLAGILAFTWLAVALVVMVLRAIRAEGPGFGRAYAVACLGGLAGTLFAGLLGDWILPFVYNIGLNGFRDSYLPWLLLGGIVVLNATRPTESVEPLPEAEFGALPAPLPPAALPSPVGGALAAEIDPPRLRP